MERARHAVRRAVRRGDLVRPSACEDCGRDGKIQGAHTSYEREHWLNVRWLCRPCHARWDGDAPKLSRVLLDPEHAAALVASGAPPPQSLDVPDSAGAWMVRQGREVASRIRRASDAVRRAIGRGELTRPLVCEACGRGGKIEGAHFSYEPERRLDVRWLCRPCHMRWDREQPKHSG
jgi:hypothetical protein